MAIKLAYTQIQIPVAYLPSLANILSMWQILLQNKSILIGQTTKDSNNSSLQTNTANIRELNLGELDLGCSVWVWHCFLLWLISCYAANCLDS